jgi:predicted HTH transcriptional regulator
MRANIIKDSLQNDIFILLIFYRHRMNLLKHSTLPLWKQTESRRLEFKEEFPKGDQIAKTVIAFANGAGGKIVFGVRNKPRQIIGISNDELFLLEEQISNHIADLCAPIIVPEFYIQAAEGESLLVVEIFPGSHKPYYLKTKASIREHTSVLALPTGQPRKRSWKNWKDNGERFRSTPCPCTTWPGVIWI